MHFRKPERPRFLLPLVALLAILAIAVGFTYSWIEGGTTYTIQSDDVNQPIKTDSVPDNVTYSGKITLNPSTSSGTITLVNYDENTNQYQINYDENTNQYQNLYFSPVSSADGETFYFPVKDLDGNNAFYREANINDVGTKFINYDFDVETVKKCYLAFNGTPTITAKSSGVTVSDTSAFRIMIKCGEEKYIFTTASSDITSTVVTGTGGSTDTLTAVPFTAYLNTENKSQKLISYNKGVTDTIEVSVWLDDGSDTSALEGCEITININLIVVAENVKATFNAVTFDKTGNKVTNNGFTGGSIKYGSTTYTTSFEVEGTSFSATAVPADSYDFMGWYSDEACSDDKLIDSALALPSQTPDNDVTYYAKFQERNVTTIYVEERSGFSTYSVYAYCKYTDGTHHYTGTETTTNNNWPGETATLDSDTGYYKFEFTTTDVGKFNVIISNNGGSQYPATNVEGLEGNIGGTYLFTADNTLIEFDPADMITVNAYGSTGGSGTVDGVASVITRPGKTIALKATPNSGYKFVGWYKDSSFSTAIDKNSTTASQNITLTAADAGKTLNYYAKFEKIPTLTLKTSVTPTGGGTAYANSSTSTTVQIGSTVNLTATASSGYRFVSWYTDSACTSTTGINSPTSESGATYTVSGTENSTVTLYAKFEENVSGFKLRGYGGDWTNGLDMAYTDSDNKYVSVTQAISAGTFEFKIYNSNSDKWYGCNNATIYNETGSNLTLATDTSNIRFYAYGGTYTFIYGTENHSLQVVDDKTNTVVLAFNANSTTVVADAGAIIYLQDLTNGNIGYRMTKIDTYVWMAEVPTNVTKITFKRNNSSNTATWNEWTNTTRTSSKRGYETTGWGTGSWK